MPFLSTTGTEFWSFTAAIWVIIPIFGWWSLRLYPQDLRPGDKGQTHTQKLVEWERDRVMTLAKGIAGTAAAYFAALIPLIFKGEISANISGLTVTGTVIGFFGALLLAGDIAAATTEFTRENLP